MVLPTPTSSAISKRGRSARISFRHRPELIGDKVDPRCVQRVQVFRARVPELSGRQRRVQCFRFDALAYRHQDDRLNLRFVVGRDLAAMEDREARFGIAWKDIEHRPRDVRARPEANDSAFGNAPLRLPCLESDVLDLGPRSKLLEHASTLGLSPIQGRLLCAEHAKKSVERVDVSVGVLGTQSAGRQVSPPVPDPLRLLQPIARLLIEVQSIAKGVPILIEHPQQSCEIQSGQRIHAPLVDQALLLNREPVDDVRLPPVLTKLRQLALKDSSDRSGDDLPGFDALTFRLSPSCSRGVVDLECCRRTSSPDEPYSLSRHPCVPIPPLPGDHVSNPTQAAGSGATGCGVVFNDPKAWRQAQGCRRLRAGVEARLFQAHGHCFKVSAETTWGGGRETSAHGARSSPR